MDTQDIQEKRGYSVKEASKYLGIGASKLISLGIPCVRIGRRRLFDKRDLDAFFESCKLNGSDLELWLGKKVYIDEKTPHSGGSMSSSPTVSEYAKALGLKT